MEFRDDPKMNAECPSATLWSRFLIGSVDEQTQQHLSQHLQNCSECLQVLDQLSSRPMTFDRTVMESPFLHEVNYLRLLERVSRVCIMDENAIGYIRPQESHGTDEPLPEMLGRFVVKGVLGIGGFGRVYLADDPLLRRTVAIKAPRRAAFGTDGDMADFVNEARHAAALDHPGIVPIYDVLADDTGRALIVMKHIEGLPLSVVHREGPLELSRTVRLMISIARAVHFAHERGFVHRDLKPSNILIDDRDQPHVTDFGLGLKLGDSGTELIRRGGTLPYMSPEQVRHEIMAIDRRSDIWALGVMLTELVHGRRPFPQKDKYALEAAITTAEPLIESARETSDLDLIIRRCLAKMPTERFATADALANELSLWLQRHFPAGIRKWRYGWRRNVVIVGTCLLVFGVGWLSRTQNRRTELAATLSQLETAPPHQIPKLITRLVALDATTHSVSDSPIPSDTPSRFRLNLALLALGGQDLGDQSADTIAEIAEFLQTAQPDEIVAVVQSLSGTDAAVYMVSELAKRLSPGNMRTTAQFRLSATLAGMAPRHAIWPSIRTDVSLSLIKLPVADQQLWFPLFDPIGASQLDEPLEQQMTSTAIPSAEQTSAAGALARFLADEVSSLARLVAVADFEELPLLAASLKANRSDAVPELRRLFDEVHGRPRSISTDDKAPPTDNDLMASRLAISLWLLDDLTAACLALRHDRDPTLQTLVIHGLAAQDIEVETILSLLRQNQSSDDERSRAIKFGLLQVLAEFPREKFKSSLPMALMDEIWLHDPDSGVHSSARLVASRLGIKLSTLQIGEHGRWLAEPIGDTVQDFAIIEPCVAEMGIGDLDQRPALTTPWPWHQRRFSRRIAVALNEVTIQQFRSFDPEFDSLDPMLSHSSSNAAIMLVNLDLAYRFCNHLSERSGMECCYGLRPGDDGVALLVPKPDHLALTGYRLPTDGEWELACRSDTVTSRFLGNEHVLVRHYGWMDENKTKAQQGPHSTFLSQQIAAFLPNRYGLFDTYGNAKEICDLSADPVEQEYETIDSLARSGAARNGTFPTIRGICFMDSGAIYARSHCRTNGILADRTIGMRVVRTLSTSDVLHGTVP